MLIFSYNFFFCRSQQLLYALAHPDIPPFYERYQDQKPALVIEEHLGGDDTWYFVGGDHAVLVTKFGVGPLAQSNWFRFMLVLSILAIPGALLEYYFTTERIESSQKKEESRPFSLQLRDCLRDKAWLIVIVLFLTKSIESQLANGSMLYYANWVLANSVNEDASIVRAV